METKEDIRIPDEAFWEINGDDSLLNFSNENFKDMLANDLLKQQEAREIEELFCYEPCCEQDCIDLDYAFYEAERVGKIVQVYLWHPENGINFHYNVSYNSDGRLQMVISHKGIPFTVFISTFKQVSKANTLLKEYDIDYDKLY